MTITKEQIEKAQVIEELDQLIKEERLLEKLLERASRAPDDPREVAYLWNLATECRDHARILSRHRREIARKSPEVPYPRWPRGKGPQPAEALERSQDLADDLGRLYQSSEAISEDPYLRKFLLILSEEHYQRALEIRGIADGSGIFEDIEESVEG